MWKYAIILVIVLTLGYFGVTTYKTYKNNSTDDMQIISPFVRKGAEVEEKAEEPIPTPVPTTNKFEKNVNIMLLGIDRRSRDELGYRTDIMILMSANQETHQVVLVSMPRDLWWNGERLNSVFLSQDWTGFQTAVETITGIKPDKYILTDFKDFSWIVDAMGGVPVKVDTTFTDEDYPVDETKGYQTITFTQGEELLTGERALIFSRSRKGNNGEGSDWMRMKRQHKILKGMLGAVLSPKSIFNPMVVESAFKTVTTARMDTNLTLADAQNLWSFYKDKNLYSISSLYLDGTCLTNPPLEEYGGAWVLVPTNGNYAEFHKVVEDALQGIAPEAVVEQSTN